MKILFDAAVMEYPVTGIAKATLGLYKGCLDEMPSLQIAALHRRPLMCTLPPSVQSIQSGAYLPNFLWRKLVLPRRAALERPDIIHFPWNGNVPRDFPDVIVVTTLYDVLPLMIPHYFKSDRAMQEYRKKVQSDIDRTHLLITVSQYSKKEIMSNFNVKCELVVLHPGPTIEASNRQPNSELGQGSDYFLYVGGYDPRKGIDVLVRIFIDLHRKKMLSSKLILTGSKNYFSADFKQLVDEGCRLGIVEEMGYVSDETLANLLSGARALVYPSKYEGFGLPLLEAMTFGCPVITTRYTSIPEVCEDSAYYIEPDDEKDFAEGLIALEKNEKLRSELKIKGKKQAAKFSWRASARIFLDAITNIVHK